MLIYWAEAYILSYKKRHRSFSSCCKKFGLEVNTDVTKNMVMSRDQNAEQNTVQRLIIAPLKRWSISVMWGQR
jgi:hypothetical protein